MRIYLTGASGFVGSNLAHVFAHGTARRWWRPAMSTST